MATKFNRFTVNILCIADSASVTDLQSKILQVLSTVPKLTVKTTNFDTWVDGMTGEVREFDENGKEIVETPAVVATTNEPPASTSSTVEAEEVKA